MSTRRLDRSTHEGLVLAVLALLGAVGAEPELRAALARLATGPARRGRASVRIPATVRSPSTIVVAPPSAAPRPAGRKEVA